MSAQLPVPEDGLIAFYNLEGNGLDESGNFNDGSSFEVETTTDRFGDEEGASIFNGVTSSIQTNSSFDFDKRSVSVWVNTEATDGYGEHAKVAFTQDSHELNYGLFRVDFNDGNLKLWSAGNVNVYSAPAEVNQWYHFVMIRDEQTVQYFVNSQEVYAGYSDSYGSGIDPNENLTIGCGRSLTYQYFQGKVDDLAIYNRVLIKDEIEDIYYYQPLDIEEGSLSQWSISLVEEGVELRADKIDDNCWLKAYTSSGIELISERLSSAGKQTISFDIPSGIILLAILNKKGQLLGMSKSFSR